MTDIPWIALRNIPGIHGSSRANGTGIRALEQFRPCLLLTVTAKAMESDLKKRLAESTCAYITKTVAP